MKKSHGMFLLCAGFVTAITGVGAIIGIPLLWAGLFLLVFGRKD